VDALIVGGRIHECSIALNLAKRAINCVVLEKDDVARHALEFNSGGARTLGSDKPEIPLALRPLKPVTLGEFAALDIVEAAS
jgi:sarcosine oxidase subunit beta